MTAECADVEDKSATRAEVKRELQALIQSIPNVPKDTDLSFYGISLFDDVFLEAPSLRVLQAACRKVRRESEFLPSIKRILAALTDCASVGIAVSTSNLGGAGEFLLNKCGSAVYASWFTKLSIQNESGDTIVLAAPNRFVRNWINQHFDAVLLQAFQSIRPDVVSVIIVVAAARKEIGERAT
jgi:hypothetical protein